MGSVLTKGVRLQKRETFNRACCLVIKKAIRNEHLTYVDAVSTSFCRTSGGRTCSTVKRNYKDYAALLTS